MLISLMSPFLYLLSICFCEHIFQEVPDFTSQFTAVDSLESKPLKGLRIGLIRETLDNGVDGEVNSVIRAAASHLEELGCSINEVYIFFQFHSFWCFTFLFSSTSSLFIPLFQQYIYIFLL